MEKTNGDPHNDESSDTGEHRRFKLIITFSVLIGCWIVWFISGGGLIVAIVLSVIACLCGEYLGQELLSQKFEKLSVQHSGFSVLRVLAAIIVVMLLFGLIALGRFLLLR